MSKRETARKLQKLSNIQLLSTYLSARVRGWIWMPLAMLVMFSVGCQAPLDVNNPAGVQQYKNIARAAASVAVNKVASAWPELDRSEMLMVVEDTYRVVNSDPAQTVSRVADLFIRRYVSDAEKQQRYRNLVELTISVMPRIPIPAKYADDAEKSRPYVKAGQQILLGALQGAIDALDVKE